MSQKNNKMFRALANHFGVPVKYYKKLWANMNQQQKDTARKKYQATRNSDIS
jgi:hypothetical protein